ncbi:MAG: transposase [Bacteroidetes bacterium]|nr:transposase [Bacteroidota bacterium]
MVVISSKSKFRRKSFTPLTNSQWGIIKEFVDNGRKRKYSLVIILNAILKVTRTGVQWRNMDTFYPAWQINWTVEITKKSESKQGFVHQVGRWQVERSSGWFNFFRRLSYDFEKTIESSLTFTQNCFYRYHFSNIGQLIS